MARCFPVQARRAWSQELLLGATIDRLRTNRQPIT